MSPSIMTAAFVLGAVLLLIAILRGSFKIFGAEVDGSAGRFGRIFAGFLGLILVCIGLFGSLYKSPLQPSTVPPPAANTTPTQQQTRQLEAEQTATGQPQSQQDVNIDGAWHGADGSVYQISQHGNKFTIRVTGMNFEASGSGELQGHQFDRTYEGQYSNGKHYSGRCSGTVSTDATVIRSTCFDSVDGPWESVLMR
jgi:hypothetical protein